MQPNMIEALESERAGLEARIAALASRIEQIDAQLGVKSSRERRPGNGGAEKRPE